MLTRDQKLNRQSGIGGSDLGAIAGVSKYKTPLEVYLSKIGVTIEEDEENESLYWGNALEGVVAEKYAKVTGKTLLESHHTYRHPTMPWMLAHVDRIIQGEKGILECKTAGYRQSKLWGEEGTDQIPVEYLLQCAHYSIVMDVDFVDIAVLIGGNQFRIYKYIRNSALEEKIIKIEEDFWKNHVELRIPPDSQSVNDSFLQWPISTNESSKTCTEEIENIFDSLKSLKRDIAALEKKEEELKSKICEFMKNDEILISRDGIKLAIWKTQLSNRLDTFELKLQNPELYHQFIKQTSSRVFKLIG